MLKSGHRNLIFCSSCRAAFLELRCCALPAVDCSRTMHPTGLLYGPDHFASSAITTLSLHSVDFCKCCPLCMSKSSPNSSCSCVARGIAEAGQTPLLPLSLLTSSTRCAIGCQLLCVGMHTTIQASPMPRNKSRPDCAPPTHHYQHILTLYSSLNYLLSTCSQLYTHYLLRVAFCLLSPSPWLVI